MENEVIEVEGPPAPAVEYPTGTATGAAAVSQLVNAFANAKPLAKPEVPQKKSATFTVAPVNKQPAKPVFNPGAAPPPKHTRIDRRDHGSSQMDKVGFDRYVINYYMSKINSCKSRGIAFNLTFLQVKALLRAKKCQYTGVLLTHGNGQVRDSDLTIERINNKLPYETGNVCAVSFAANQAKAAFDSRYGQDAVAMIHLMSKQLKARGAK